MNISKTAVKTVRCLAVGRFSMTGKNGANSHAPPESVHMNHLLQGVAFPFQDVWGPQHGNSGVLDRGTEGLW